MIALHAALSQHFAAGSLPEAVRAALGKPLRRAAPLTQLAVVGALACLPAERRALPTALLWQSTAGPRPETLALLDEICRGPAEPMPYDFLASQPAIAAAQLKPVLPGLASATHLPLDTEGRADWALLIDLAAAWLAEGRCAQVLCAHLDRQDDAATGHWLALGRDGLPGAPAVLRPATDAMAIPLTDTPDLPERLRHWLLGPDDAPCRLPAPAGCGLALEFARL